MMPARKAARSNKLRAHLKPLMLAWLTTAFRGLAPSILPSPARLQSLRAVSLFPGCFRSGGRSILPSGQSLAAQSCFAYHQIKEEPETHRGFH
jgi:hypothetical protein